MTSSPKSAASSKAVDDLLKMTSSPKSAASSKAVDDLLQLTYDAPKSAASSKAVDDLLQLTFDDPKASAFGGKRRSKTSKAKKSAKARKSVEKIGTPVFFEAWYESKPKLNKNIKTQKVGVKLDDDDEWLLTGITRHATISQVKKWCRSLGTLKKNYGKQRLQVYT
jgi:hypothetical protein